MVVDRSERGSWLYHYQYHYHSACLVVRHSTPIALPSWPGQLQRGMMLLQKWISPVDKLTIWAKHG